MAPATASLLVRYSILYINVKSTNVTVILATQACFAFFGNANPVHDRIAGLCARKIRKWLTTPMSVFFYCLSPGFTVDLHSKDGNCVCVCACVRVCVCVRLTFRKRMILLFWLVFLLVTLPYVCA